MPGFLKRLKFVRPLRSLVYTIVGAVSYPGLAIINKLRISGTEHIKDLPRQNVLFVSNHQTYFADVITFLHIFCAVKWGRQNRLGFPWYLLNPFTRVFYVAAEETMKGSLLSRFFTLGGAITVKRTWNPDHKLKRKGLDPSDTRKIERALQENWVITFPQGTTKPFAPGRKGTALIIKRNKPVVVPVVINGFWRAFNKKGVKLKKKGVPLTVRFKPPLELDYEAPVEEIMDKIMQAIEQSREYMMKGGHHRAKLLINQ